MLVKEERGNGYGSEAVQMIVDYPFLHKDIVRVQAETYPEDMASQRVLEKAGFKFEGCIRKSFFSRGVYRDTGMYSIPRDEWNTPQDTPSWVFRELTKAGLNGRSSGRRLLLVWTNPPPNLLETEMPSMLEREKRSHWRNEALTSEEAIRGGEERKWPRRKQRAARESVLGRPRE